MQFCSSDLMELQMYDAVSNHVGGMLRLHGAVVCSRNDGNDVS